VCRSASGCLPQPADCSSQPLGSALPPIEIRRVFILRPDHLGDLVLFSGALRHLRRRWPGAEIALCARPFGLELFAHCPHVDTLVSYDRLAGLFLDSKRLPGLPNVRGACRLSRYVRRGLRPLIPLFQFPYRCDLALLPLRSPQDEHNLVMRHIPARLRVGVQGGLGNLTAEQELQHRSIYSLKMDVSQFPIDLPELEMTRRYLEFIGATTQDDELWPEFWTTEEDRDHAEEWVVSLTTGATVGVAPGVVSAPGKRLPPDWFARAIERSGAKRLRVVLLGSAVDAEVCSEVEARLKKLAAVESTVNLTGKTTVRELIECVRRCDFVLTQETATLHVATALRKPVVGIVGGGHFGRFFPYGDSATARFVHKRMDCFGCNWRCHYDTVRCVQEIPPEAAAKELRELFSLCRSGGRP